jgi:endonuclease-3
MPATYNKQRVLTQLLAELPRGTEERETGSGKAEGRPVLEQFLYALCREGTTRDKADRAFRSLRESFFDWNEIRVSSIREVAGALQDLPRPELRAQRIISFLQEVFETTYSFDLEGLHKKGLKEAAKKLDRFEAANDYSVSWVIQKSLGGHAVPVDAPTLRVVRRLGLVESDQTDIEAVRTSLEHQIPKAKGPAFTDLVSKLANDFCLAEAPLCPRCPLGSHCPKLVQQHEATTTAQLSAARSR